jgi:RNA polymerase sigma-70 factor (ECF subfamily)
MAGSWQDEEQLRQAFAAGCGDAMAELFARHQQELFLTLYHIVGHVQNAEDLVQDTWKRARERHAQYRPGQPFYPWLRQVARHLAFDQLRGSRRTRSFVPIDGGLGQDGGPADETDPGPLENLIREENLAELHAALDSLSAEIRSVFYLFYVDEMPAAEIAESKGEAVGTIYRRLHQARRALRQKLGEGRG